jgi:ABC-type antimicrobial peptide transport system permease subunit
VRFIYAYWVKKEMPMKYIVKAGISVVLVVVISALIPFIG